MLTNLPYQKAAAVTKSDSTAITQQVRSTESGGSAVYPDALLIGGAGNVVLVTPDDHVTAAITVIAGQILPITVKRVNSTNTTATNIEALWY